MFGLGLGWSIQELLCLPEYGWLPASIPCIPIHHASIDLLDVHGHPVAKPRQPAPIKALCTCLFQLCHPAQIKFGCPVGFAPASTPDSNKTGPWMMADVMSDKLLSTMLIEKPKLQESNPDTPWASSPQFFGFKQEQDLTWGNLLKLDEPSLPTTMPLR
ncbi:hypothetical protein DSO57_1025633 [Entomophthora muscae]|uniref:Uncharacterized protein n=1 Tax=Entomophthora muscae TaxID=34485 RepID=A0ACC2UMM6_9FUNG|nr:hypothetical protein DSO57_1025633 [Entomophthora muscae]